MTKYAINNDFVLRKDESLIFDARNFIVHRINDSGMQIVRTVAEQNKKIEDIYLECSNLKNEDIREFLETASDAGFIIKG